VARGDNGPQPSRLVRAGRAIMSFLGLRTKAADLLKGPRQAAPRKKSGGGGKTG
jgi:hypothetical protein